MSWQGEKQRHAMSSRGIRSKRPGHRDEFSPGKFEVSGDVGKDLYDMVLMGYTDDQLGDVQHFGWYGLILDTGILNASHVIVKEDSDGFFYYTSYDTISEARREWELLEKEYTEFMGETERS